MSDKDHGPRLGADPEMFVQNQEGVIVPVCGKVGGTKEAPIIVNTLVDTLYGIEDIRRVDRTGREGNYAVQEDNVMLEFNIPAYKDCSYFTNAISKMMGAIDNGVLAPKNLRSRVESSFTFKAEDLAPFPQAFTIGCLPDMNAYAEGGVFERAPFNAAHFGNNRFCGGHLHIQFNKENVPSHIFAQFMDISACLPFLRWDKQRMRRMFYGQPGIYRDKPYGIEYRTLSNFWISQSFRDRWLTTLVENVLWLATSANTAPDHLEHAYALIDWGDVQQAIQGEDLKLAEDIVEFVRNKTKIPLNPPASRG